MSGHGQKLSRKQELAVASLLTQPTIVAAAEKTGVSEATLNRWMKREEFKEAFREARRDAVSQAVARLHQACAAAVATLVGVMADDSAPTGCRVSAAKTILEMAMRAVEVEELECRLVELEDVVRYTRSDFHRNGDHGR